eukprot:2920849-Rhodomonas_salina.2
MSGAIRVMDQVKVLAQALVARDNVALSCSARGTRWTTTRTWSRSVSRTSGSTKAVIASRSTLLRSQPLEDPRP